MRFTHWMILLAALVFAGPSLARAADAPGSKEEAVALVQRAAAHLTKVGPDKAFADFDDRKGAFVDRDLYVVVYDLTGKCLAHGANAKLIGKDLSDAEDIDGKLYIKERMEMAKVQKSFWQDYKFTNPVTKKIMPKQMYCEVQQGMAICAGVYKK